MLKNTMVKLLDYKRWANQLTFEVVMTLPEAEILKPRETRFGNIAHTLNHVYVVDNIFKAHLEGREHGYTERNTASTPPIADIWAAQQSMDDWWCGYVAGLSEDKLQELISFTFVGGGEGAMTRNDIMLHIVNHGTYHRGFVGDMLYQSAITPPANDYSVYIRDIAP